MDFESILFGLSNPPPILDKNTDFLVDLNIHNIVESIASEKKDLAISPFFYMPVDSSALLKYRYDVFRDILDRSIRDILNEFTRNFIHIEKMVADSKVCAHPFQSDAIYLNGILSYIDLIESLLTGLKNLSQKNISLKSIGLIGLVKYLDDYCKKEDFTNLKEAANIIRREFADIRIGLNIKKESVRISKGGGLEEDKKGTADYADDLIDLFSDFWDNRVEDISSLDDLSQDHRKDKPHEKQFRHERGSSILSSVEYSIIEIVAKIYPRQFNLLSELSKNFPSFLNSKIKRFFLELQFYLGYYDFMKSLGTGFCFPKISTEEKQEQVIEGYDLSLAIAIDKDTDRENKSSEARKITPIVKNDYHLTSHEKIIFITGPNRSGKTSFLRMIGQLHYLMKLGVPVPAKGAALFLPDNIFTHFERSESLVTYNGKLKDDLERIHTVLEQATTRSLILINEIFVSTTFVDAIELSKKIFALILKRGIITANVGFLYELSNLHPALVSFSGIVDEANPFTRNYKIVRREAEKRAYAELLVKAFHLTEEDISGRILGRALE